MRIEGLLGRKIGMTTYYREDGGAFAVTAVEVGPCVVTQVKTKIRATATRPCKWDFFKPLN